MAFMGKIALETYSIDSLVLPEYYSLNECFSTKVMSSQARRLEQPLFDYGLSGYTGMIKTWCEQRCLSQHPIPVRSRKGDNAFRGPRDDKTDSPSNETILDGNANSVSNVQKTSDIGRWQCDYEESIWLGFAFPSEVWLEELLSIPPVIPS